MKTLFLTLISLIFCIQGYAQQEFSIQPLSVTEWIDGDLYSATKDSKNASLVILIPGSGPTDRNGNQVGMQTNAYKLLAEELSKKGISVFTYDKSFFKQIEKGVFKEDELVFEESVEDVEDIVQFFKKNKKYKSIYLAGHSEGSLVGILMAQKEKITGFISIAGSGKPIDLTIKEQISKQAPFLMDETTQILEELKKGNQVDEINPYLVALFRKEVQPFLISWMKYDPKIEIGKLKIPILILQGTKDIQVPEENAELLHQGAPNSKLIVLENMNHVLKNIEGGDAENMASYNQLELPISSELVLEIQKFIQFYGN